MLRVLPHGSRRKDCGCEDSSRTRGGRPPADAGRDPARARGRGRFRDRPRGLGRQPCRAGRPRDGPGRRPARPAHAGARRPLVPRAAAQARPDGGSRDPLELQRPGADRSSPSGRRPRLRRQDGRARRSGDGAAHRALEHVVHGVGSGGGAGSRAAVRSDRPERARDRRPRCRGAWALEPGDRTPALDQRADGQVPPAQRLPQARDLEPHGGGAVRVPHRQGRSAHHRIGQAPA